MNSLVEFGEKLQAEFVEVFLYCPAFTNPPNIFAVINTFFMIFIKDRKVMIED